MPSSTPSCRSSRPTRWSRRACWPRGGRTSGVLFRILTSTCQNSTVKLKTMTGPLSKQVMRSSWISQIICWSIAIRLCSIKDTFRLHVNSRHQLRPADTGRWVRRGLKCSPRALHVQNDRNYGYNYTIPLELWSGPPSSCCLTKIHLLGVSLNRSFVEQIGSACDVLEELELKSCEINFQKITSPSLKSLIIHHCSAHCGSKLIITAPRLASLHLNLNATYDFVLLVYEMVSLVKASIHNWINFRGNVVHDNHCEILSSLSNVTSLELLGFPIRLLPDEEPVQFPTFKNLTTLLLDDCELGDKFQLLQYFL